MQKVSFSMNFALLSGFFGCYYLHRSRDSMSPVGGIFRYLTNISVFHLQKYLLVDFLRSVFYSKTCKWLVVSGSNTYLDTSWCLITIPVDNVYIFILWGTNKLQASEQIWIETYASPHISFNFHQEDLLQGKLKEPPPPSHTSWTDRQYTVGLTVGVRKTYQLQSTLPQAQS